MPSPSTACSMMKKWFCEEIVTLCVLSDIFSGFGAKPLMVRLMKRIALAASTCVLALGNSFFFSFFFLGLSFLLFLHFLCTSLNFVLWVCFTLR